MQSELEDMIAAMSVVRSQGTAIDREFALGVAQDGRRRRVRRNWAVCASGFVLVLVSALILCRPWADTGPPSDPVALARHIEAKYSAESGQLEDRSVDYLASQLQHEHPAVVRAAMRALYSADSELSVAQSLSVLQNARASLWYPSHTHVSSKRGGAVKAELADDWARTLKHALRGMWFRLAAGKERIGDAGLIEGYLTHSSEDVRYLAVRVLVSSADYRPDDEIVKILRADTEKVQAAARPLLEQEGE